MCYYDREMMESYAKKVDARQEEGEWSLRRAARSLQIGITQMLQRGDNALANMDMADAVLHNHRVSQRAQDGQKEEYSATRRKHRTYVHSTTEDDPVVRHDSNAVNNVNNVDSTDSGRNEAEPLMDEAFFHEQFNTEGSTYDKASLNRWHSDFLSRRRRARAIEHEYNPTRWWREQVQSSDASSYANHDRERSPSSSNDNNRNRDGDGSDTDQ